MAATPQEAIKVDTNSEIRDCDVVMKGGITSGVVYPGAVAEVAQKFRLRGIGGTSAGAIAAAAAAAAEYGRATKNQNSFKDLAELPAFLGRKNSRGDTNLFRFFQPQPKTKRVFDALTGALEARNAWTGAVGLLRSASFSFPLAFTLGTLPGGILFILALSHPAGLLTLYSIIIGWILVMTIPLVAVASQLVRRFGAVVPENFFGLCSGMSTDSKADHQKGSYADGQALTIWLTKYLNHLAGLDPDGPPLTFGQLWSPRGELGSRQSNDTAAVRLEMYTTCLTKGRPFRLPFQNDNNVRENVWYYRKEHFARLFPPSVVRWMNDHPRTHGVHPDIDLREFRPLPDAWNLPVVFAARLSLSFPILLSAVPLFALQYDVTAPPEAHEATEEASTTKDQPGGTSVTRFWFSDGGICSNFPIHFFDAPLPRWPTFAINLVEAAEGAKPEELVMPWMPETNNQGIREPLIKFDEKAGLKSVFAFVSSIVETMQNWSDNTLSRMPGFRDRIATVGLTKEEGGLNLKMPASRIERLNERGINAGAEFVKRFAINQEPVMNWANHRWVRLRTMLSAVMGMLSAIDRTCANPEASDEGYEQWIRSMPLNRAPSYQWKNADQRLLGIQTIHELREIAKEWANKHIDSASGAPRPRPELRPRPRT
jgi:predicted acylesterase/phospholipase RssA